MIVVDDNDGELIEGWIDVKTRGTRGEDDNRALILVSRVRTREFEIEIIFIGMEMAAHSSFSVCKTDRF